MHFFHWKAMALCGGMLFAGYHGNHYVRGHGGYGHFFGGRGHGIVRSFRQ